MAFTSKQVRALQRRVPAAKVRTRKLNGREFPYIEGWLAISEANRIFGFDGWDRETIDSRCVVGREIRGSFLAIYIAKVRVTVRSESSTVVREGTGSGEARSSSPGEAHEIALKAAETDGTKRALATFGKPFGLALYLDGRPLAQSNQSRAPQATKAKPTESHHNGLPFVETRSVESKSTSVAPTPSATTPPNADVQVLPTVPGRVDKSVLTFGEPRRERDKHHLIFVATQPCLICSRAPCDAHHLRFAQSRAIGRKVGDQFTVPLCRMHHRQLHECSDEAAWWSDLEVDALEIAKGLWEESRAKRAALVRSLPGSIDPIGPPKS